MLGKLSLGDKSSAFKAPAQRGVSADQAAVDPEESRQVRQHTSLSAMKKHQSRVNEGVLDASIQPVKLSVEDMQDAGQ